jgi:ribosomal protein S18 acetylase RimI-like enzyme
LAQEGTLGRPQVTTATIRRARPGDAAVIARMANALNRHEALSSRAFTAAVVRRDAFGRRRAFSVLVADVGGRVVGYASYVAGYNTDVAARELWMHDLFVQPTWRGRGVGRALVTAVAREAARRGFACLAWAVRATNARAIRFYRRLGARVGHARIAALRGRALASVVAGR